MEYSEDTRQKVESLLRSAIEDFDTEWITHEEIDDGIDSYTMQICEFVYDDERWTKSK